MVIRRWLWSWVRKGQGAADPQSLGRVLAVLVAASGLGKGKRSPGAVGVSGLGSGRAWVQGADL